MKKISKILSLFLLIFVLSFSFSFHITTVVRAEDAFSTSSGTRTDNQEGKYKVVETLESSSFDYGIKHIKDVAQSSFTTSSDRQEVNILQIPSTTGVKVVSWANLNNHQWTLSTVRDTARDYEAKNPGWRVLGAVNGDFFDINGGGNLPFQTTGAHISEGNFYKTTTGKFVGFKNDGSINSLVADMTPTRAQNMTLSVYNEKGEIIHNFVVEHYNAEPTANKTAVFYGTYNKDKNYVPITVNAKGASGFFVKNAELALPNNNQDFYGLGVISDLNNNENVNLEKGQFGIVTKNEEIKNALSIGTKIRVQWTYTGDAAEIDSATGASATLLKNGEWDPAYKSDLMNARHPRTVIGRKADGSIIMAVVDGRWTAPEDNPKMYGMTGQELAAMMRRYDAVEAYNLDGGGSSTFVLREGDDFVVKNKPSDKFERRNGNALLVVVRDPELDTNINAAERALTFKIDVKNNYNHDIQKLYVSIGTSKVEVVNGIANFKNLKIDTAYDYSILYETSTGKTFVIPGKRQIYTQKSMPVFDQLGLIEDETSYHFEVKYTDKQGAGNFANALVTINGNEYHLVEGKLSILKSEINGKLETIMIKLEYDLNNNKIIKMNISNPQFRSAVTLYDMINNVDNLVDEIFK